MFPRPFRRYLAQAPLARSKDLLFLNGKGSPKLKDEQSERRKLMVFSRGQNRNRSTEKNDMHLSPLISRPPWFKDSVQFSPEYKVCVRVYSYAT